MTLSSAVGAFVGGASGGGINDVVIDANVAQNAVENNDLSFWNLSDLQRTKVLQNGSINDKIKSLVEAGLTKEQIKESLANNADFKALTKDGDAKFDKVFVEQKTQVDATNTKIDNIVLALEASGMATMFVDGATVKLSDIAVKKLVQEAITKGLDPSKISPEKIVSIAKVDGKIVWLEKGYQVGDKGAGLEHIIQEHADDFLRKGISKEEIPKFIMTTLSKGKIVEYQGTGTGRPVYEVIYKGVTRKVAITVGDNGFIVGANPR